MSCMDLYLFSLYSFSLFSLPPTVEFPKVKYPPIHECESKLSVLLFVIIFGSFLNQVFLVTVWNFEVYMIPLALLLLFAYNFITPSKGKVGGAHDSQVSQDAAGSVIDCQPCANPCPRASQVRLKQSVCMPLHVTTASYLG